MQDEIKKFREPLQPHEIEWKIQTSKNGKTLVVPYIDNRAVMSRLDECFSPEKWESTFTPFDKGFICTITINGIQKSDGSDLSDIEPIKGGISNAMKRAASQWGLGRELYKYPKIYITGEHKYIPDEYLIRLNNMVTAFIEGKINKEVYFI